MEFRVLGALEVLEEDRSVSLGGPKQRAVLAHLLIRANRLVPAEVLIGELWGDEPPEAARGTLQAYVSRLRSALGDGRVEGRPPGYVLHVGTDELDASRFESLVRDARADAAQDPAAAAAALEDALRLWRGSALADLSEEPSLAGEIARLEELRLAAVEEKLSAELALGRHARLVGDLEALTREHPLRERLWGDLMLALYRSGRQAEALEAFQRARTVLAGELGIDPSRRLRRLHERILAQDPELSSSSRPIPVAPRPEVVPGELTPDTELAGYRIEDLLGRGGMSTVYLAQDQRLQRRIALKVLSPALSREPGFRERFMRESQIAARMEHPGIVPIYEAGEAEGHLYIAMRYVRGTDLRRLLAEHGPLDPRRAVRIVRHVADALDAAHAQGLVHRDVKPGNILLVEGGEGEGRDLVYLSDFGLTKRLEGESGPLTKTGQFVGTVDYVAPEQIEGRPVDRRVDVYSLACALFECLTGRPPFRRETEVATLYGHVHDEAPNVSDARPALPPELDAVLAKGLAKDPAERYATCRELAAAAREVLDPKGHVSAPPPAPRFARHLSAAIAAGLAIAVSAGGLVFAVTRHASSGIDRGVAAASSPTPPPHFETVDRAPTPQERRLLSLIPSEMSGSCKPYVQPSAVLSRSDGAVGAVACRAGAVDVLYELFDNRGAMDSAFGKRVYAVDAYGGTCATDVTAQSAYSVGGQEAGRVMCHRSSTMSMIAWTDERLLVFGEAVREDLGDVDLYTWWRAAGPVVQGTPVEKDAGGSVPRAPEGTYLIAITKREDAQLREIAPSTPGSFRGSWGLRVSGGTYDVTQLGRFGAGETGTYVVSKGPRLVFTTNGSDGSSGSAAYRWRVLAGGQIQLTLDRTFGVATTNGKQAWAPGPWPMTLHPWTRAPTGELVYSTAQNQMVLNDIQSLDYKDLSLPSGAEQDNIQPVWSPDGSRIAFVSNRDGSYDLYVMDADGSNVQRLTNQPGDELDPAWSPDGTKIAFHHNPPTGPGPTTLSVLDLADGAITDLVAIPGNVGKLPGTVGRPDWSSDGTRIVFRIQRRYQGSELGFAETSRYVVNADGSGLTKLAVERNVRDSDPVWTPDGSRILFWGDRGRSGTAFLSMRPDGSGVRPFGVPLPRDFLTLDWSPDGRWMVLGGAWDHPYPLHLVSADGADVFVLEPSAGEPRWRPSPTS